MKRRDFINWAGLGLIASYLPVALVACSDNTTETTTTTIDSEESLSMGTVAQLQETGYLLNEEAKVMVVKDSDGQLMAVNPTCTHRGCTVEWKQDSNTLVCPCHDAQFAADGEVLAQPATEALPIYEVEEEDGEVLVKLA